MKYVSSHRVNVRTIRKIEEGQGLTLRNGRIVEYKTGWQVATHGVECRTPEEVSQLIHSPAFRDHCGIWLSEGIYYVDYSYRVLTKKEALEIGAACNQQTIYSWGRSRMPKIVEV
jgi:hypothetical protein